VLPKVDTALSVFTKRRFFPFSLFAPVTFSFVSQAVDWVRNGRSNSLIAHGYQSKQGYQESRKKECPQVDVNTIGEMGKPQKDFSGTRNVLLR
jgi:hypothetical protein